MPRYKLSPEERAAEKERKENLRNIIKGLDVNSFDDLKDVFKLKVGETEIKVPEIATENLSHSS